MARLSDVIEQFIKELMRDANTDMLEISGTNWRTILTVPRRR